MLVVIDTKPELALNLVSSSGDRYYCSPVPMMYLK